MITTLFIIAFIFCVAITVAGIMLGYRLITTYSNQFLHSYFYYLISFYAFAFYGIWAQLLVRYGLNQIKIDSQDLSLMAIFLPILGLPFLFISWVMLVKMSSQINGQVVQAKNEILTHSAIISIVILILAMGNIWAPESLLSLPGQLPIAPLSIFLLMETIYFIVYGIGTFKSKVEDTALDNFNRLLVLGLLLRLGLFIISLYFTIVLPLTITFYFLTNLISLAYLWRVSDATLNPIQLEKSKASLIEQRLGRFKITKREKEIIQQIALGKTNQQIADDLFISLQTVKDHTHRIYRKIGINSRMQLIRLLSQ